MQRKRLLFAVVPALMLALAAPSAGHAGTAGFDLVLSHVESVDPVAEGEVVHYTLTVLNGGPRPANPFTVHVDVSPGTITGASGARWSCMFDATDAGCVHNGALPANRSSSPLVITVTAPDASDGPIFMNAAVSGGGDTNPANNAVAEDTDVSGDGAYSANIGPEGGSITTDDGQGATAENPFFGTVTFPAGGPGGVARVAEHPERLPECEAPPVEDPEYYDYDYYEEEYETYECVGDTLEVIVPPGYINPADPIVIVMTYDVSIVNPDARIAQVVIKPEEGDDTPEELPWCDAEGVAIPSPCVDSQTTLENGDVEVTILMISGDPWYQGIERPSISD